MIHLSDEIAAGSLAISALAIYLAQRSDRRSGKVQERLAEIEEERHAGEVAKRKTADVVLHLVEEKLANPSSLWSSTRWVIFENRGEAPARSVEVLSGAGLDSGEEIEWDKNANIFPIPVLHQGVPVKVFVVDWGPPYRARYRWLDDRGPQERDQTVTLER